MASLSCASWAVFSGSKRPNKRLKLTGADRSKGNGVLCAGGHGLSSTILAPADGSPAA